MGGREVTVVEVSGEGGSQVGWSSPWWEFTLVGCHSGGGRSGVRHRGDMRAGRGGATVGSGGHSWGGRSRWGQEITVVVGGGSSHWWDVTVGVGGHGDGRSPW